MVEYYGAPTPLQSLAGISVPEARQLLIQPYDKSAIGEIEKAIQKSELGLVPNNDGSVIRITIPQLTEERRLEFVKVVHQKAEDARVSVRNIRRDDVEGLRKEEKDGKLSEDQLAGALDELQKLTDNYSARIDDQAAKKEAELREV
jgi:ribosome recycling factor